MSVTTIGDAEQATEDTKNTKNGRALSRLHELEQALVSGRLQPSDAKVLVSHLSRGIQPPADLLARAKAALNT